MERARIILKRDGQAQLFSPYNPSLVAGLKAAIPWQMRSFDGGDKSWSFHPQYMDAIAMLCRSAFGYDVAVPKRTDEPQIKVVKLMYLGNAKDRGGDESTSFGWIDGGWNIIFPERILREWFLRDPDPAAATTLYAALGVGRAATTAEIKKAYRSAARTHHPDVGGNRVLFEAVQEAYKVLADPERRAMYNSGLAIVASLPPEYRQPAVVTWKPPMRCGVVMVKGLAGVGGKMLVTQILGWEDIVEDGKVLLVYWKYGDKKFTEIWR